MIPSLRVIGVLFCLSLGSKSYAADPPTKKVPLTLAELNERPVIGKLGVPLGTWSEIQATIIAGRDLRLKAYDGVYLLSVTHVAGKQLAAPVNLRFETAPVEHVELARNGFELRELKTGKKSGELNEKERGELEKGYVGKSVRLTVYEIGGFRGLPRSEPDGPRKILWADHEFFFTTSLVVLRERK